MRAQRTAAPSAEPRQSQAVTAQRANLCVLGFRDRSLMRQSGAPEAASPSGAYRRRDSGCPWPRRRRRYESVHSPDAGRESPWPRSARAAPLTRRPGARLPSVKPFRVDHTSGLAPIKTRLVAAERVRHFRLTCPDTARACTCRRRAHATPRQSATPLKRQKPLVGATLHSNNGRVSSFWSGGRPADLDACRKRDSEEPFIKGRA